MSEKKGHGQSTPPDMSLQAYGNIYYKMVEEVEDYAIILLDIEGRIQNWNKGAEKIKQYNESEAVGMSFKMFYLPNDREQHLPDKMLELASTRGRAVHEGWRLRKDGSRFWGSIVITALHNDAGEVIGFSKVTRDLTERKFAEEKQQRYLLELEAQNRELERFAYVASHDLQEPLRKIRTFIDVIGNNLHDKELISRMFAKINLSAERMGELIKAILNYSRLEKDDKRETDIDLNKLLKSVIDDFEVNIQEKDALIRSEELPSVRGNELQIGQVFSNIIGNALKFSHKRPEIKISGKIVPGGQLADWPTSLVKGDYLEIIFADNGIGFDQQYAKQIFLLFQRLHGKQEYSGTGIGLALCKRIMENHGGFISAWSEQGNGARFHIYLPV